MSSLQTLQVRLPSGRLFSRRTSKPFTHAVCSDQAVIRWCSSEATARKALLRFRELPGICIVSVHSPQPRPVLPASDEGPQLLLEMLTLQRHRAYRGALGR